MISSLNAQPAQRVSCDADSRNMYGIARTHENGAGILDDQAFPTSVARKPSPYLDGAAMCGH